jgi:hypothetical protein
MTENFTNNTSPTVKVLPTFTPKETTKVSEVTTFLNALEQSFKTIEKKIEKLPDIVMDASMKNDELLSFGYTKIPNPDIPSTNLIKTNLPEPYEYFNKETAKSILTRKVENDMKQLKELQSFTATLLPNETLKQVSNKLAPDYPDFLSGNIMTFNSIYPKEIKNYQFINTFLSRNLESSDDDAETDAIKTTKTTKITTTEEEKDEDDDTTTSGNSVDNITMGTLWSAIGPIGNKDLKKKIYKTSDKTINKTTNKTTDQTSSTVPESTYAPADCSSGVTLSEETESRLVKNMMSQIKDQLLINRKLDNPQDSSYSDVDEMDCPSNCAQQGSEWKEKRPDMSRYIRKDSIPCWNCSP